MVESKKKKKKKKKRNEGRKERSEILKGKNGKSVWNVLWDIKNY